MTLEEIRNKNNFAKVVILLMRIDNSFKTNVYSFISLNNSYIFKQLNLVLENNNFSNKKEVIDYLNFQKDYISSLVYNFINNNNEIQNNIKELFETTASDYTSISGKVAKTTVNEWPEFIKNLNESGLTYNHMSTSVVGEAVFVFFA